MNMARISVLAAIISACGPPSAPSVDESDSAEASSSSGGGNVPAAPWMSGAYSSLPLNPGTANGIGFDDKIVRYYFREGSSFEEAHADDEGVEMQIFRVWEPLSETTARVSRAPDDYASLEWYELELAVDEDGCSIVVWTGIDESIEPGSGPTMWPGEVCVAIDEPVPMGDRPTYHLEWCGETPPGCDDEGCECQG
jgi:hypothetical protein